MVEQIKDPVSDECHIIVSHSAFIYFIIVFFSILVVIIGWAFERFLG